MTTKQLVHVFEVASKDMDGLTDARGQSTKSMLASDAGIEVSEVRVILGYQVKGDLTEEECQRCLYDLFADPIIEKATYGEPLLSSFQDPPDLAIQVGFKPGVTDNSAQAALDGLTTIFEHHADSVVATNMTYAIWGTEDTDANKIANAIHNPMIERCSISMREQCKSADWPSLDFPEIQALPYLKPATVNLEVSDEELLSISEKGLLALNLEEMQAIQRHYRDEDVRLARAKLGPVSYTHLTLPTR